jgi:hypothetical protein
MLEFGTGAVDADRLILQHVSTRKKMWLVKLQWTNVKAGSPPPPEYAPTQGTTMVTGGEFTAFGRREGFDCYLFINRTDAEIFKKRVEDPKSRKNLKGLKPQIHIVEVTPEDVAHLDLDPVRRKNRAAAPQI